MLWVYRIDTEGFFCPKTPILLITGPTCPVCAKTISSGSLQTQLEVQIREHIAKYYEGWTLCDDPTCNYSTRMMVFTAGIAYGQAAKGG